MQGVRAPQLQCPNTGSAERAKKSSVCSSKISSRTWGLSCEHSRVRQISHQFHCQLFFIGEPSSGSTFNSTLGSKSLVFIHIGCFQKASRLFGMEMDLVRGCNYEPQCWILGSTPLILSNARYIIYP